MTTIFLSGSRTISRLNVKIRQRIKNITDQGFHIIIGDANGADKALQKHLADVQYPSVTVFCSGKTCRNNVGNWDVRQVAVDSKIKGREFYTQKDKAMAAEADYGFILWDGKSTGSINNLLELLKRGKSVVVYFVPEKQFYPLSHLDDVKKILNNCDEAIVSAINKKVDMNISPANTPGKLLQRSLNF
jgi:hypothetical protein